MANNSRAYIYCPWCGRALETRVEEGDKERKFCRHCEWTHYPAPVVAVLAIVARINPETNEAEILMVKRNREPYTGTWMFPAGFLEFGEKPEDALARELREETGLRLTGSKLFYFSRSDDDPRSPSHLVACYIVSIDGEINNNDEEENAEIRWHALNGEIEVGFKIHRFILDELRKIDTLTLELLF